VLRSSFEVLMKLYKRFYQIKKKMIDWCEEVGQELMRANQWMSPQELAELHKLICYAYRIKKEEMLQVGTRLLYDTLKRR
jgi:hypothetical protein